jgi:hypothetical protein
VTQQSGPNTSEMEGEYQAPGWDKPCPRFDPNGHSQCEHRASEHAPDGVCAKCADAPAALRRPCSKPIPEDQRGRDPMESLHGKEVSVALKGHSRTACGLLSEVRRDTIVLEKIERPVRLADNGGTYQRAEIENITEILDSWREGRSDPPPRYS